MIFTPDIHYHSFINYQINETISLSISVERVLEHPKTLKSRLPYVLQLYHSRGKLDKESAPEFYSLSCIGPTEKQAKIEFPENSISFEVNAGEYSCSIVAENVVGLSAPTTSTIAVGTCPLCGIPQADVLYRQDFSINADGSIDFGAGSVSQSDGFTPKYRSNIGVGQVPEANPGAGPFSRFRPRTDPFFTDFLQDSPNGFVAQLAIYLDVSESNGLSNDERVDYSVALNCKEPGCNPDEQASSFVQDFFFNSGFYDETVEALGLGRDALSLL